MVTEVKYYFVHISMVDAELLRDINTGGKEWAVVRESARGRKAWSFHASGELAKAAARRWLLRDIVTR